MDAGNIVDAYEAFEIDVSGSSIRMYSYDYNGIMRMSMSEK